MENKFFGNNVLLVTPFKEDYSFDEESYRNLIEYLLEKKVDGLIPLGTTGEFFTLAMEEKKRIIDVTMDQAKKRVPVCIGVGYSGTHIAMELARYAESKGADAVLVPPPYYYQLSEKSMFVHFTQIAKSVGIDVMLYDGASGVEIPLATIKEVHEECRNIRYIKVSVLKSGKVGEVKKACNDEVMLLCGDEVMLLPELSQGAIGMATAAGNVLPEISTRICHLFMEGKHSEARNLFLTHMAPWIVNTGIIKSEFIRCFKEALFEFGIIKSPTTRPPVCPLDSARLFELKETLQFINKEQ